MPRLYPVRPTSSEISITTYRVTQRMCDWAKASIALPDPFVRFVRSRRFRSFDNRVRGSGRTKHDDFVSSSPVSCKCSSVPPSEPVSVTDPRGIYGKRIRSASKRLDFGWLTWYKNKLREVPR